MRVPEYRSQTRRSERGGAQMLSVQASPSGLSADSRALAGFGQELAQQGQQLYRNFLTVQRKNETDTASNQFKEFIQNERLETLTEKPGDLLSGSFENRAMNELKAIANKLTDSVVRKNFEKFADAYVLQARGPILTNARARQIDEALAASDEKMNLALNDGLSGIGGGKEDALTSIKNELDQSVNLGLRTQREADVKFRSVKRMMDVLDVEGRINNIDYNADLNAANQLVQSLETESTFKDLTRKDRIELRRRAINLSQQIQGNNVSTARSVLKTLQTEAEGSLSNALDNLQNGSMLSDDEINEVNELTLKFLSQAELNPGFVSQADQTEINDSIELMNEIIVESGEIQNLNPRELQTYIAKKRTEGQDTQLKRDVLSFLEKRQKVQADAIEKRPLEWADRTGAQPLSEIDFSLAGTNPEVLNKQLKQRLPAALNVQDLYGKQKLKFITQAEQNELVIGLEKMPGMDQLALIGNINEAFGKRATAFYEQISDDADMFAYLGGLSQTIGVNAPLMNRIVNGMQYETQLTISNIETQTEENFANMMFQAFAGLPNTQRQTLQPTITRAVRALATLNNATNPEFFEKDNILENLFFEAMGGIGQTLQDGTGGVGTYDERYVLRPPGVDNDMLKTVIEALPDVFDSDQQLLSSVLAEDHHIAVVGQTPDQEYIYNLYVFDDFFSPETSRVVTNKDGPISFSYTDVLLKIDVIDEEERKAKQAQTDLKSLKAGLTITDMTPERQRALDQLIEEQEKKREEALESRRNRNKPRNNPLGDEQ